jgi:PKD repeat protein
MIKRALCVVVLITCLVLLSGVASAEEVPPTQFNRTVDFEQGTNINSMTSSHQGGYFLVGENDRRVWLAKTDPGGTPEFEKEHYVTGGLQLENTIPQGASRTRDGNYFVVGSADYGGGDGWLVKINQTGYRKFQKLFQNRIIDIIQHPASGYLLLAGQREGVRLIKINRSGGVQFTREVNIQRAAAREIIKTSDGGYAVLTGRTILKFDSSGRIKFKRNVSQIARGGWNGLHEAEDGALLVAGRFERGTVNQNRYDYLWYLKFNETGKVIFNRTLKTKFGGGASDIADIPGKGYVLSGRIESSRNEVTVMTKTSQEGERQWNLTVGSGGSLDEIITTANNGIVSSGEFNYHPWLIKLGGTTVPPNVAFQHSPEEPAVNETVQFDATLSNDIDGSIVDYEWDFGDGSTGHGPTPIHTYEDPGSYTVTLTITDDKDATNTTRSEITVGTGTTPPPETLTDVTVSVQQSATTRTGSSVSISAFLHYSQDIAGTNASLYVDENDDGVFSESEKVATKQLQNTGSSGQLVESLTYNDVSLSSGKYGYEVRVTNGAQATISSNVGELTVGSTTDINGDGNLDLLDVRALFNQVVG